MLIYKSRWKYWWDIDIEDSIVLTPFNEDRILSELMELCKNYVIIPIGSGLNLFPIIPPEGVKGVIVDLSTYNRIEFINGRIRVQAGVRYIDLMKLSLGEGMVLPLNPPINVYETIGGLISTGMLRYWYNMPWYNIIDISNFFDTGGGRRIFHGYGMDNYGGIILNIDFINWVYMRSLRWLSFLIDNIGKVFDVVDIVKGLQGAEPRFLSVYRMGDGFRCVMGISDGFVKKVGREVMAFVDEFEVINDLPSLYVSLPDIDSYYLVYGYIGRDRGWSAVILDRYRVIYLDYVSGIYVLYSDSFPDWNGVLKVLRVEDGVVGGG
jgi:hypothetical protein